MSDFILKMLLDEGVKLPEYKTYGAAAFDLCANETVEIMPNETKIISTGIKVEVPAGMYLQISLRSGVAAKGKLIQPNAPGIIDSDYRGVVGLIIRNMCTINQTIKKGNRIAQAILLPSYQCGFLSVSALSETKRGTGGFGSTG